jgi:hypothetical protein
MFRFYLPAICFSILAAGRIVQIFSIELTEYSMCLIQQLSGILVFQSSAEVTPQHLSYTEMSKHY